MTATCALEAMGVVSESGALLLVKAVEKGGMARTIMIDATLSELDDLEERAIEVQGVWILSPTPSEDLPVRLLPVDEILQPYFRDGERRDEVVLRCASGAWYRLGADAIERGDPMFSCWRGRGKVLRRDQPALIEPS